MKEIDNRRVFQLNDKPSGEGPVVYWMSRDQRVRDNWTLIYASELSRLLGQPLVVVFCRVPSYLNAQQSHFEFMLGGLSGVREDLEKKSIPFRMIEGDPGNEIPSFLEKIKAGALVTDFNPLKINRKWKNDVARYVNISFAEVDTHNIVPCRIASDKQEFSARTIRPKISRMLHEFLTDFPSLKKNEHLPDIPEMEEKHLKNFDQTGEKAAMEQLQDFIQNRLENYDQARNHPELNGQSGLSPYLHFGQLSAQRIALEIKDLPVSPVSKNAFLEELIVRRELSDNFCFYNENYDSFKGFPAWAQKSLNGHRSDPRDIIYSLRELENASTGDPAWNAAQRQMLSTGKMHGYMRMYWAKKILEWTHDPEEAMEFCIYLNDRYSLDGRDPNGYTGISWSIGGTHDRPWKDRKVFGQIRYMNFNGLKSKTDIKSYILQHSA